jgi:hypothetical protein
MVRKRLWRAVSPAGSLDLGWSTEIEAVDRLARMGHAIAYIDWENAVIFFGVVPVAEDSRGEL